MQTLNPVCFPFR